jgi:hypothetical protein
MTCHHNRFHMTTNPAATTINFTDDHAYCIYLSVFVWVLHIVQCSTFDYYCVSVVWAHSSSSCLLACACLCVRIVVGHYCSYACQGPLEFNGSNRVACRFVSKGRLCMHACCLMLSVYKYCNLLDSDLHMCFSLSLHAGPEQFAVDGG